jgi:Cu-Zn family superoxide dismutase
MGNVKSDAQGNIYFNKEFDLLSLFGSENIIGRSVILHQYVDQGMAAAATNGAAGQRIAQGIIGISPSVPPTIEWGGRGAAITRVWGTTTNPNIAGLVTFMKSGLTSNGTWISYDITGLPASGTFGMHVHEWGDETSDTALAMGAHYNPYNQLHGCYPNSSRHMGDLGSIRSDSTGRATGGMWSEILSLHGLDSVIGRGLVIHANADNCVAQSTGNAGGRIAQGAIGIRNDNDATYNAFTSNSSSVVLARVRPTTGWSLFLSSFLFSLFFSSSSIGFRLSRPSPLFL